MALVNQPWNATIWNAAREPGYPPRNAWDYMEDADSAGKTRGSCTAHPNVGSSSGAPRPKASKNPEQRKEPMLEPGGPRARTRRPRRPSSASGVRTRDSTVYYSAHDPSLFYTSSLPATSAHERQQDQQPEPAPSKSRGASRAHGASQAHEAHPMGDRGLDMRHVFRQADRSQSGWIDPFEFERAVAEGLFDVPSTMSAMSAFQRVDSNGLGC